MSLGTGGRSQGKSRRDVKKKAGQRYVFYYTERDLSSRLRRSNYHQYEVIVSEGPYSKPYISPSEFEWLIDQVKSFEELIGFLSKRGNYIVGRTGALGIEFDSIYATRTYSSGERKNVLVGIRKLSSPP